MRLPLGLLVVLLASPAWAQLGPVALSGSNGVLFPAGPYSAGSLYTGGLEVTLSPTVALRPSLFYAETAVDGEDAALRRVGLGWDVLVRWPRSGSWQPYLATGVSMQTFRFKVAGRPLADKDELNFGMAFAGGLNVALTTTTAITFELTYYLVERGPGVRSPSAGAFRGGLRQAF